MISRIDLEINLLVHRFVNNCADHVGCGFECAGKYRQGLFLCLIIRIIK